MNSHSARPLIALVGSRRAILRNLLLDFRRDSLAKAGVIVVGLGIVLTIGFLVAYHSFRFIEGIPPIGVQLNSRLLGLLFLVLLTMVALSNAIVSYASLFLARETGFFFENPLSPRIIFFTKLAESTVFSGWATLIICLPILVAFGIVRHAPAVYYVEALGILFLFIVFCGLAGTGVSLVLLTVVRRWTARKLLALSTALIALLGWTLWRSFDFSALNGEENLLALNRFTVNLTALQSSFFPSTWATSGILAAASGEHRETAFNAGLLLANTLIFIPALSLYAGRLYGRRWAMNAEPPGLRTSIATAATARRRARRRGNRMENPVAALARKDLLTFVRDPAQISQFILFMLLAVVYVLSLVQIPSYLFKNTWRLVLFFSNIAAISLILSSFTSRFLFPLLSLEGKAFWIIGLAPVRRDLLVRQKISFGRNLILTLGVLAGLGSSLALGHGPELTFVAVYVITLSGWIITALAVGFGAAYPNLSEDNPARIAVGFGGTVNFFASAIAVFCLLVIEALPYLVSGAEPTVFHRLLSHAGALVFALVLAHMAGRVGERALTAMEF